MKITDLKLEIGQFGKRMNLTSVEPYYIYEAGKKTDKIGGYKYNVVLLDKNYEKISVKIAGNKLIEEQEKYDIPIKFVGLEVGFYQDFSTKNLYLKATAKSFEILK